MHQMSGNEIRHHKHCFTIAMHFTVYFFNICSTGRRFEVLSENIRQTVFDLFRKRLVSILWNATV